MKYLTITILITIVNCLAYSQTKLYTLNSSDYLFSEDSVASIYQKSSKQLPPEYGLKPVIYHKVLKNDTIINYITFEADKDYELNFDLFNPTYIQDSLFLQIGKKIPDFTLKGMDGNKYKLSDFLGTPIMINFWAMACSPCVAEIPDLNKIYDRYSNQVKFIAITDNYCTEEQLRAFLKIHPYKFLVLIEGDKYKRELKIGSVPKNIFVNSEGVIEYIQGNYPLRKIGESIPIDDPSNYFVKLIEKLIIKR